MCTYAGCKSMLRDRRNARAAGRLQCSGLLARWARVAGHLLSIAYAGGWPSCWHLVRENVAGHDRDAMHAGGQFMRAVVERCQGTEDNGRPRMHTLVTMGGQHQV